MTVLWVTRAASETIPAGGGQPDQQAAPVRWVHGPLHQPVALQPGHHVGEPGRAEHDRLREVGHPRAALRAVEQGDQDIVQRY
jgi:hypothetical protein